MLVRVGGGYLSIDEFLDIYTPMELDRVDRNDPLKKFSEKIAVQKTLSMNSPMRSPARANSNTRSSTLLNHPILKERDQSVGGGNGLLNGGSMRNSL